MGNSVTRCTSCFDKPYASHNRHRRRRDTATVVSEPFCFDEGLGHSFCYVRPESTRVSSSKVYNHEEKEKEREKEEESATIIIAGSGAITFRTISGASVSANTSTPPLSDYSSSISFTTAASFDSSDSFFSVPLQPIPRFASGPLSGSIERGFLSGPIERGGFLSGPLDSKNPQSKFFRRSFSNGGPRKANLLRGLKWVIARSINLGQNSTVAPSIKEFDSADTNTTGTTSTSSSGDPSLDGEDGFDFGHSNLHWAQGKAGEDRVHVVISEEHGWVFVGIYDGFNGPDAPDYLLSSLYTAVQKELKGLLWEDNKHMNGNDTSKMTTETGKPELLMTKGNDDGSKKDRKKKKITGVAKKWEDSQKRWKSQWDKERLELDRKLKEQLGDSQATGTVNHSEVLDALSEALKKTEQKYLDLADSMVTENPELALMGSCVLVMLMKGEDVYLMNVGDSRAVLGRKPEPDVWDSIGKDRHDLERINEESVYDQNDDVDSDFDDADDGFPTLASLQLTLDHSTSIYEEINRIRTEHPDDALAVTNDRVKGSLKVTRAFGAGFLKQPRWNNALLEMFRIDYVGSSPYISCDPSLRHHRLTPRDRFLILSSDGLYQYLTNEEAVAEVELFMAQFPEGDPAQHLVEEVMFRAARNAGMDFHELLEIPQGDRRRYHDDVSIIIISLEGRIWRSSV